MSVDEIIKSIRVTSNNELTSLGLKGGESKLSLECEKEMSQIVTIDTPSPDMPSMQMAVIQNDLATPSIIFPATTSQGVMMPQAAQDTVGRADIGSGKVVTSPLVGIFYDASPPDATPFAQAGGTMRKSQVLGVIEAMKLMSGIEGEYNGIVEVVPMNNEEVVEYDQPLFRTK